MATVPKLTERARALNTAWWVLDSAQRHPDGHVDMPRAARELAEFLLGPDAVERAKVQEALEFPEGEHDFDVCWASDMISGAAEIVADEGLDVHGRPIADMWLVYKYLSLNGGGFGQLPADLQAEVCAEVDGEWSEATPDEWRRMAAKLRAAGFER